MPTLRAVVDDTVRYEFKGAVVIRGMEAKTIARWRNEGWELVGEKPGRVRLQLMFRRPKPLTAGDHLAAAWVRLRRLRPAMQACIVGAGGLVLVAAIIGISLTGAGGATGGGGGSIAHATPRADAVSSGMAVPRATETPTTVNPTPEPDQILTTKNNDDLAALLDAEDPDAELVEAFANRYRGRTIAFDANIADLALHGNYKTRYDVLLLAGDHSEDSARGPYFKYEDVNTVSDLHYVGSNVPDAISVGDAVRVRAEVSEYNSEQGTFYLIPVSTRFR